MTGIFNFRNKKYGLSSCGEVLLRLSPINNEILVQGKFLEKNIGGAELNVVSGVSNLGVKTSFITKLPKNELGRYAKREMRANGVNIDNIIFDNSDKKRLALYFYEYGVAPRKPNIFYDRKNSSFQFLELKELDKNIFKESEIFHISGITLGLCEKSKKLTKELISAYKENQTIISFDVNFRRELWKEEKYARREMEEILPYIDILFASEETFRKMFKRIGTLEEIMREFAKKYNIKVIASTQRKVNSPKSHDFSSTIYEKKGDKIYREKVYRNINVLDRIGSGDSYIAGVLYGILKYNSIEKALQFGDAFGTIKSTIVGDINNVSCEMVENIIFTHKANDDSEMNR